MDGSAAQNIYRLEKERAMQERRLSHTALMAEAKEAFNKLLADAQLARKGGRPRTNPLPPGVRPPVKPAVPIAAAPVVVAPKVKAEPAKKVAEKKVAVKASAGKASAAKAVTAKAAQKKPASKATAKAKPAGKSSLRSKKAR